MRNHYLRLLERELDRLFISQETVIIIGIGNDKFMISDGRRSFKAKGHEIYRKTKRLQDRASYSKFWAAMKDFPTYAEGGKVIAKVE